MSKKHSLISLLCLAFLLAVGTVSLFGQLSHPSVHAANCGDVRVAGPTHLLDSNHNSTNNYAELWYNPCSKTMHTYVVVNDWGVNATACIQRANYAGGQGFCTSQYSVTGAKFTSPSIPASQTNMIGWGQVDYPFGGSANGSLVW